MTKRPTILATRRFPDAVERRLARDYRARLNLDDRLYDPAGLVAAAEGADGLFVSATERFDADQIARLPTSVGILGTLSVGLDHIDLDAARASGFKTAFVRRPDEWGPPGPPDPGANPDCDIIVDTFPELAEALGVSV